MATAVRLTVPLARAAALYPALADRLAPINQALRSINVGRVDYLPFDAPAAGYHVHMRAELTPQGAGRPPQVGHWQIEISRDDSDHALYLQGKHGAAGELGEIVFRCGATEESEAILRSLAEAPDGGSRD
jgi:hypothetical protein